MTLTTNGVNTGYGLGITPVDTYTRYFAPVPMYATSSLALTTNVPYKIVNGTITAASQTDTPNGVVVQLYKPGGATTGSEQGDVANGSITSTENDGTCLAMVTEPDSPHVTFQGVVGYAQTENSVTVNSVTTKYWWPLLKFKSGDRFYFDTTNKYLVYDPISGPFEFISYSNKQSFQGGQTSPFCTINVKVTTATYAPSVSEITADTTISASDISGKFMKYDVGNTTTNADLTLPASTSVTSDTYIIVRKTSATGTVDIKATGKTVYALNGTDSVAKTVINGKYVVLVPFDGGNWRVAYTNLS